MTEEIDLENLKYIEGSTAYKALAPKDRLRFNHILRQLMYETENSFTATEYYYLAMMKFMGEDIEQYLTEEEGFKKADPDMRKDYRMMAEDILDHMSKYREGKRVETDSTKKLKELIKEENLKNGNDKGGKVSGDS